MQTGEAPRHRSFVLGLLITLGVNAIVPYTQDAMRTVSLVESMIPMGVLMPFLLLVFVGNPLLRLTGRRCLDPRELVTIVAVVYVGSHAYEVVGRVLSMYASLNYMATPENQWEEFLAHLVPAWLVVPESGERLDGFFEGWPADRAIPWDIWLRPTFAWTSFIAAFGLGSIAIAAIFRAQWVDRERLSFPFARVIESLASTGESGLTTLLRSRLFWVGALIPAFIIVWYIIGFFRPDFPVIELGIRGRNLSLGRHVPAFRVFLYFPMVGFSYFTDLRVLFSLWAFYVLTWGQIYAASRVGLGDVLGTYGGASQQAYGGFIVFSLWTLWIARGHLRDVWRSLHLRTADTATEILSPRGAAMLLAGCAIYMVLWLAQAGLNPLFAAFLTLFWFIFYVGFAKIVAMTGLVFVESPGLGSEIPRYMPPGSLAPKTSVVGRLIETTYQNGKCFAASDSMYAARLLGRKNVRRAGGVLIAALLLALLAASISTIVTGYAEGASNFGGANFRNGPGYFNRAVSDIRNQGQTSHYLVRTLFIGFGALAMGVLTTLHYRFTWWPLHPIGFMLVTFNSVQRSILSVFVAWIAKTLILRIGGFSLYRTWTPFFIGMIVGTTFAYMGAMAVDLIWFPGAGHNLYRGD